jgi:hypothetical protein
MFHDRDYYKTQYNLEFTAIKPELIATQENLGISKQKPNLNEEPKKNFQKMLDNDRKILRFSSSLLSDKADDRNRVFVVSFYLADDTVGIYEPPQR